MTWARALPATMAAAARTRPVNFKCMLFPDVAGPLEGHRGESLTLFGRCHGEALGAQAIEHAALGQQRAQLDDRHGLAGLLQSRGDRAHGVVLAVLEMAGDPG